jgi:hypothetical protein
MNLNYRPPSHRCVAASLLRTAAGSCILGLAMTPRSLAIVSDEDFSALKSAMQQMSQEMQDLKKAHEQDQSEIHELKQELGTTQAAANNAVEKANAIAPAMPTPNALHNFSMVGDAEVQYAKTFGGPDPFGNASHNGFLLADFAPIFLYQANEKILFEAGFDIMLQNGSTGTHAAGSSTSVSMSFGQLDFLANDYLTVGAGYMLLPLGTYSERGAGWLNKIPDAPLGREFLPSAGAGVQLRGAFAVGESGQAITYAVYAANGPSSTDNTAMAGSLDLGGNVGLNADGSTGNLHSAPSGGGRVGWFFPWGTHKDLELGLSGQTGVWDDAGTHYWSAGVLDAALHLGPSFELKGEFINSWTETSDLGTLHSRAVWAQAGYKLAGLKLDVPFLNDIELVDRYDTENNGQGTKTDRFTTGFVYYLTNTLLLEGDYEFIHSSGPNALPPNFLVFQISYGF